MARYSKGAQQERHAAAYLSTYHDYYVTRSAGSKGAFDLIAFPLFTADFSFSRDTLGIQVKSTKRETASPNSYRKELREFESIPLAGANIKVLCLITGKGKKRRMNWFVFSGGVYIGLELPRKRKPYDEVTKKASNAVTRTRMDV